MRIGLHSVCPVFNVLSHLCSVICTCVSRHGLLYPSTLVQYVYGTQCAIWLVFILVLYVSRSVPGRFDGSVARSAVPYVHICSVCVQVCSRPVLWDCGTECSAVCSHVFCMRPGLFSAGSMGLWHGVQYFEQKKLNEAPYYRSWPPVSTGASPRVQTLKGLTQL